MYTRPLKPDDSYQSIFEKAFSSSTSSPLHLEKEIESEETSKEKEIAPSEDVIAISDESDSDATETEIDPQRNMDFIEEASVGDDEFHVDDFPELFQNNINEEHHKKIVDELLQDVQTTTQHEKELPLIEHSTNFDIPQQANHNQETTTSGMSTLPSLTLNMTNNNNSSFLPIANKVADSTQKTASLTSDERSTSMHAVEQSTSSPSRHVTQIDTNSYGEILNYLKRIEKRLGNIEKRLTKIEESQNIRKDDSDSSDSDDLIDDDMLLSLKFPIKKRHSLEILENILKVPKMKRNLELKFKQYLGINENDTIDMILAEMLDPNVQSSFKWRQTDTTRSFENFVYINKLIFDCVKHHFNLFTNVEYIRLMSLILNRPCRISAIQRNFNQQQKFVVNNKERKPQNGT